MNILDKNNKITTIEHRKNVDLLTILTNVELVENNEKTKEIIANFYEYLIKFGIDLGISSGKQMIIDGIKNDDVDMNLLMNVNPENYTKINFSAFNEKEIKEFFK